MPRTRILASNVETAVQKIVPFLEDTRSNAPKLIYFDGWGLYQEWGGVCASVVLRAIAERPPSSLREKFDKIIHLDCSRWEGQRALQRVISDELKLTQEVAADFQRQDEEDDFAGVDLGSRAEVEGVARVIVQSLVQYRCLVIFHNGSNDMVDLTSCGIPQPRLFDIKVLWTFGGRFRRTRDIEGILPNEHHEFFCWPDAVGVDMKALLAEEAREIALYTHNKHGLGLDVTPEIATDCYLYLLSLHEKGDGAIDYNWIAHASSYWVCDGIISVGGGHGQDNDQAWELARALQQQIRVEDYSSPYYEDTGFLLLVGFSTRRWICVTNNSVFEEVLPETTSLFFSPKESDPLVAVPSDRFHKAADQLRVLKLCRCTFSFSSPPFHCCRNLRFLGLDSCEDHKEQQLGEDDEKKTGGAQAVEIFQRLWVLDVCHTDWQLAFPPIAETEEEERVAAATQDVSIREVHIKNGRIWRSGRGLAWRRLPNLRRLRVVEPTSSWETPGRRGDDAFRDMVNLELLDLSGNSTIQVLPSLSGATGLKTLVLDGCVGLEHVGPQGLPPSLESFSLDTASADEDATIISRISLAGCARLSDFKLRGAFPNLEELDLSRTAVKMLDLRGVVQVRNLQRVFLVGCEHLRSVNWPEERMGRLRLLCIDTRPAGGDEVRDYSRMACQQGEGGGDGYHHQFVGIADMRFLQSLVRLWKNDNECDKLNLCCSSSRSSKDDGGRSCGHEKIKTCHPSSSHSSTAQLADGSPLPSKPSVYHDLCIEQMAAAAAAAKIDGNSSNTNTAATQSQQAPKDFHMEIGEGVCDVEASTHKSMHAMGKVMNKLQSLHVHDSYSITTVARQQMFEDYIMDELKWCRVERCPKLDTVFPTSYYWSSFSNLETFWAAHLLMASSIWSRPTTAGALRDEFTLFYTSFDRLRAIHLYFCPRLRHVLPLYLYNKNVLPLSSNFALELLETLHILCCGDLKQVFPVEEEFQKKITAFPKLKDLYLYELPSLQQICEAKTFAPNLETIYVRGCWGLRRLPATGNVSGRPPVAVDCEKDWWDNLEWDGMESGHHSSLFQRRHSRHYKRRHLRGTVLR